MLRLQKNWSQFELSEMVEISEEQLCKIETGKSWTGEVTCALLAKALDVPLEFLFDFSENEAFVKADGMRKRASRKSKTMRSPRGR